MSTQKGNISHEGEISLARSELETRKALGNGTVLNLNLNAVVCYGNPAKGDVLITDKINGLQFTEEAKEINQGDKFMEVTIPARANVRYCGMVYVQSVAIPVRGGACARNRLL
jgi:hypothetical protein